MKSKSAQLKSTGAQKQKVGNSYDFLEYNKPFDFAGFYKTAAETSKILEKYKTDDAVLSKDNTRNKLGTPKGEHSVAKTKKKNRQEPLDISQIKIDASSLNSNAGARAQLSSPKTIANTNRSSQGQEGRVKSIMKNHSISEQPLDSPRSTVSSGKSKKRNKSVSFMLDDNEEVVIKRTKSDDPININKNSENAKTHHKEKRFIIKKRKKNQQAEKENTAADVNKQKMDVEDIPPVNAAETNAAKLSKTKKASEPTAGSSASNADSPGVEKKKKIKKIKKNKSETKLETIETENNSNELATETKIKKKIKKKKQAKVIATDKIESGDGDDEPVAKSRKKDPKPDIVEDLENLSIGDNAHTLTNLLDEMAVVDKDKNKKLRQKFNKNKRPKGPNKEETENSEEVKEKVKWKKRKWNKDKKGDLNDEVLDTTIIVENLPLAIMLNYKKLLTDHFIKYGLIKKIGIAEVYPTEESKPVFTTTITFNSDGAADLALEENNSKFEGSRISVKRPLPATTTTVVARSYAELSDQNISSTFLGFGKIRSIRHLVKGKKAMATAFIEFDGPEAVARALSKECKIGGKRVHVAKFEPRTHKKKEKTPKNEDSAADADSEESND